MNDSGTGTEDLRCIEFVTLVTEYIDGEVDQKQRKRIDKHLEGCGGLPGCA
jgi:anti-sigma factor RsiW